MRKCVCDVNRIYMPRVKALIMLCRGCISCTKDYVIGDVHMILNVADLNDNLLSK